MYSFFWGKKLPKKLTLLYNSCQYIMPYLLPMQYLHRYHKTLTLNKRLFLPFGEYYSKLNGIHIACISFSLRHLMFNWLPLSTEYFQCKIKLRSLTAHSRETNLQFFVCGIVLHIETSVLIIEGITQCTLLH